MANLEEKPFTKAELKMFTRKYETFLEAQKEVDEVVGFLKEQHEIPTDDPDWQIGQNGFFKLQKVAADQTTSTPPPPDEVKKEEAPPAAPEGPIKRDK